VLLSPEPLDDLGQWLGIEVGTDGILIERIDGAVFVVDTNSEPRDAFKIEISLE
jgi:hypothetical protein